MESASNFTQHITNKKNFIHSRFNKYNINGTTYANRRQFLDHT